MFERIRARCRGGTSSLTSPLMCDVVFLAACMLPTTITTTTTTDSPQKGCFAAATAATKKQRLPLGFLLAYPKRLRNFRERRGPTPGEVVA